ncbi:hypothetical protein ACLOJK_032722 [Asimina triloba]
MVKLAKFVSSEFVHTSFCLLSVLTVHGSEDVIVPVEDAVEFAKIIPNHKLSIIKGANHVYNSHLAVLASTVVEFVKADHQQECKTRKCLSSCVENKRMQWETRTA